MIPISNPSNNYIQSNTIQINSIPQFQFVIYDFLEQIIPYSSIFHLWHQVLLNLTVPKSQTQGFSTVPDRLLLKIVPIFGLLLHFYNLFFIMRIEFRREEDWNYIKY